MMVFCIFLIALNFCGTVVLPVVWIMLYQKENKPVNFYSGVEVAPETISNIKEYNNANIILWGVFGGIITLSLSLGFFLNPLGHLGLAASFVWIFIAHSIIAKKYTIKIEDINRTE